MHGLAGYESCCFLRRDQGELLRGFISGAPAFGYAAQITILCKPGLKSLFIMVWRTLSAVVALMVAYFAYACFFSPNISTFDPLPFFPAGNRSLSGPMSVNSLLSSARILPLS